MLFDVDNVVFVPIERRNDHMVMVADCIYKSLPGQGCQNRATQSWACSILSRLMVSSVSAGMPSCFGLRSEGTW
jgi:hypothetical protein